MYKEIHFFFGRNGRRKKTIFFFESLRLTKHLTSHTHMSSARTCFGKNEEMCTAATTAYRGSGANFFNSSRRNVSTIARGVDTPRLHPEFLAGSSFSSSSTPSSSTSLSAIEPPAPTSKKLSVVPPSVPIPEPSKF